MGLTKRGGVGGYARWCFVHDANCKHTSEMKTWLSHFPSESLGHFLVALCLCQNESTCETIQMKMCSSRILVLAIGSFSCKSNSFSYERFSMKTHLCAWPRVGIYFLTFLPFYQCRGYRKKPSTMRFVSCTVWLHVIRVNFQFNHTACMPPGFRIVEQRASPFDLFSPKFWFQEILICEAISVCWTSSSKLCHDWKSKL